MFFLILILVLLSVEVFLLVYTTKWKNENLSPFSIKESLDTLPSGIAFYDDNGLVSLINIEMNELSLLITGKALLNGKTFWESVMLNDITNDAKVLKIC